MRAWFASRHRATSQGTWSAARHGAADWVSELREEEASDAVDDVHSVAWYDGTAAAQRPGLPQAPPSSKMIDDGKFRNVA